MNSALRLLAGLACSTLLATAPAAEPAASAPPRATLTAAAARPGAVYRVGETVIFQVELRRAGAAVGEGEIAWTLTKDGVDPRQEGRAAVRGGRAEISGRLEEPGFLQLRATFGEGASRLSSVAAVAVAPTAIRPSAPAPADFDAFWDEQRGRLAAVPPRARLTSIPSTVPTVEVFDVQVDALGAPASGYFARPKAAKVRSLPAILTVHGAGVRSASGASAAGWARDGALALDLNAHGIPNGRDAAFYEELGRGELKDYRHAGRDDRERMYFRGMFLRAVRALDFLCTQPEWDGRTLVVSGASQGGAQAFAAAGLDRRVSYFVAGVPAMCDHTGFLVGRISGWPKFVPTGESPAPGVAAAIGYFDAVNFAARTRAAGFVTVGFIDTVCPPTGVYAAFNALKGPKEIFHDITAGHTNTPAATAAMRAAVHRHFAAMR